MFSPESLLFQSDHVSAHDWVVWPDDVSTTPSIDKQIRTLLSEAGRVLWQVSGYPLFSHDALNTTLYSNVWLKKLHTSPNVVHCNCGWRSIYEKGRFLYDDQGWEQGLYSYAAIEDLFLESQMACQELILQAENLTEQHKTVSTQPPKHKRGRPKLCSEDVQRRRDIKKRWQAYKTLQGSSKPEFCDDEGIDVNYLDYSVLRWCRDHPE